MPQAITLPELRPELKMIVGYPTAPGIPPTAADVAGGIKLFQEVFCASQRGEANDEELVNALKYKTALLASDEAVPAWFAGAMTRALEPFRENLGRLTDNIAGLSDNVAGLSDNVAGLADKVAGLDERLLRLESSDRQNGSNY